MCFGIVPNGLTEAAGLIQVRTQDPSFFVADWGFALGAAFWGTGIFTEAAVLAAGFAFDVLDVHRLEARAVTHNGRGNGALQKIGAKTEGVLAKAFKTDDGYVEQLLWALTAEDLAERPRERFRGDAARARVVQAIEETRQLFGRCRPRPGPNPHLYPFFVAAPPPPRARAAAAAQRATTAVARPDRHNFWTAPRHGPPTRPVRSGFVTIAGHFMSSRDLERRSPHVTVQDLRRDLRHADEELFALLGPRPPAAARLRPRRGPVALALVVSAPLAFGMWTTLSGERPRESASVRVEVTPDRRGDCGGSGRSRAARH